MASFSSGDKVRAKVPVRGTGFFSQDVPAGTDGVVLSTSWTGSKVRVHFVIEGMFSRSEVDVEVDPDYLEKRW